MMVNETQPSALSLFDLESHDPNPKGNSRERIFRCPFCNGNERALHLNTETGLWNCKRFSCGAKGKLLDFREPNQAQSARGRAKVRTQQAFVLPVVKVIAGMIDDGNWRQLWDESICVGRSPRAKAALEARGLTIEVAVAVGVRFCHNWAPSTEGKAYDGGRAMLYPFRDDKGELRAVAGRYLHPHSRGPKARTGGSLSHGAFFVSGNGISPLDKANSYIFLVEGPACALSIAQCGIPAIAVGGCNLPEFLPKICGLRNVIIGSDCDAAGDRAATDWTEKCRRLGAKCYRVRADQVITGAKDWNEALQQVGEKTLRKFFDALRMPGGLEGVVKTTPAVIDWEMINEDRRMLDALCDKVGSIELRKLIAKTTDEITGTCLGLKDEKPDEIHRVVLRLLCLRHEIE